MDYFKSAKLMALSLSLSVSSYPWTQSSLFFSGVLIGNDRLSMSDFLLQGQFTKQWITMNTSLAIFTNLCACGFFRTFGGSKLVNKSSSSDSEDDVTEPTSTDFGYKLQHKKKKKKKKKDKSKEDKKKHKKQKKHKKEKKHKKQIQY